MHWSDTFYARQAAEAGVNTTDIHPSYHTLAARMTAHLGGPSRLLELGSGGGQFAVAAALLGHDVTAIERVPLLASHGRSLALNYKVHPDIQQQDFFTIKLPDAHYGAVCCWDTFGIGEDHDQRHLLTRMARWLAPEGRVYVDVFTPWYWAYAVGNAPQLLGFRA